MPDEPEPDEPEPEEPAPDELAEDEPEEGPVEDEPEVAAGALAEELPPDAADELVEVW